MSQIILVVEDEIKIAELIGKYLTLEGYEPILVDNGIDALAIFKQRQPALVILDVMLPGMNGLSVCERLRAVSDVPIILLTARVQDVDRLIGFASGADDYVCKPFNPQELMARVRAILRRIKTAAAPTTLSFDKITIDQAQHGVWVSGVKVQLTQIEFKLLLQMLEQPTKVFSREELLLSSRGKYTESYERTIDFHVKNLRKKINIDAGSNYIHTVYGLGYKLIG